MKRYIRFFLIALFGLAVSACSGVGGKSGGPGAEVVDHGTAAGQAGAQAGSAQMGGEFAGKPLDNPASPLSKRVFYFAFDSSEVSADDQKIIAAHAAYLAAHPEITGVVVAGHTDERGSREYNLALGERRAKAVAKLLLLQGVGRNQIQVVSFGEERPVALGHDEGSWHLNRRVELIYPGY